MIMDMARMVKVTAMVAVMVVCGLLVTSRTAEAGIWCVARFQASRESLQRGLDYACSHGANCAGIQPGGSCYLPNTIQNHASYAYNSYFQHNHADPAACNFGGTATFAVSDPSFGRCVYRRS